MYDFDKVFLSTPAKFVLFVLLFRRKFTLKHFPKLRDRLLAYRFIHRNYSGQKNHIGEQLPDGTFSTTDAAKDYFIYLRMQFHRSFLCPLLVALATSLIVNALTKSQPPQ